MTRMSKWIPTTDLMTLRRTGKTIEEMGEAVTVLARIIIQGIDETDPKSGRLNRERLADELADVRAQIDCTLQAFDLDPAYIARRQAEKARQMAEWEAMFASDEPPDASSMLPRDAAEADLLRQCHESGQMSAAQSVAHAGAGELRINPPVPTNPQPIGPYEEPNELLIECGMEDLQLRNGDGLRVDLVRNTVHVFRDDDAPALHRGWIPARVTWRTAKGGA